MALSLGFWLDPNYLGVREKFPTASLEAEGTVVTSLAQASQVPGRTLGSSFQIRQRANWVVSFVKTGQSKGDTVQGRMSQVTFLPTAFLSQVIPTPLPPKISEA